VDEFFAPGIVRLQVGPGRSVDLPTESYVEGKRRIASATGVSIDDVDLIGLTLTLDKDDVPVPPSN